MNWKGYGRKQSWSNLRNYPGICLEGLAKTTKNLSGQPVSGTRCKPGTSQIRRSDNQPVATFGNLGVNTYIQISLLLTGLRTESKLFLDTWSISCLLKVSLINLPWCVFATPWRHRGGRRYSNHREEISAQWSGHFIPRKIWVGGWVARRAVL
jgi:hypothetical protein